MSNVRVDASWLSDVESGFPDIVPAARTDRKPFQIGIELANDVLKITRKQITDLTLKLNEQNDYSALFKLI